VTAPPVHRGGRRSTYDKRPVVAVGPADECTLGWPAIAARILATGARVIAVEAYDGVRESDLRRLAAALRADVVVRAGEAFLPEDAIDALLQPTLTDDPVFGRISARPLADLFGPAHLAALRARVAAAAGRVVVYGVGATLIAAGDVLVYADLARWEIQQRQRRGEAASLGSSRADARPAVKYKRGYFVDWRLCDRQKRALLPRLDFLLDTTDEAEPRLVGGEALRRGLRLAARRPLRVVPFFDPAPWGGRWMQEVCDLPPATASYGWCFDCVPEENALLLGFGARRIEIPAIDLVFAEPEALLGPRTRTRFGDEFPIRFDFLDTVGGGNLSLQVHPQTAYMREHFGVPYTQDESYYLLDAEADAYVYLGLRTGVDPAAMLADLRAARGGGPPFPAERYVNRFPAARHDHFLIPAGTVHGAGAGSLVLEISATPYIFTFKLWDWGRLGLDGRPRPVHLDHGARNIRFERATAYARARLINRITPLGAGDGWTAERTGLHEAEFIETHRHWFTGRVPHDTGGEVQVLNLVEGEEAVVESPDRAFRPFVVHYAETFIVPGAVGPYTIRPSGPEAAARHGTIKAFVRFPG